MMDSEDDGGPGQAGPSHLQHTLASASKRRARLPRKVKMAPLLRTPAPRPKRVRKMAAAATPKRIGKGIGKAVSPKVHKKRFTIAVAAELSKALGSSSSSTTQSDQADPQPHSLSASRSSTSSSSAAPPARRHTVKKALFPKLQPAHSPSSSSSATSGSPSSSAKDADLDDSPSPGREKHTKNKRAVRFEKPAADLVKATHNTTTRTAQAVLEDIHTVLENARKRPFDVQLGLYRPLAVEQAEIEMDQRDAPHTVKENGLIEGRAAFSDPVDSTLKNFVANYVRKTDGASVRWTKTSEDEFVAILCFPTAGDAYDAVCDGIRLGPYTVGFKFPFLAPALTGNLASVHVEISNVSPALSMKAINVLCSTFGECEPPRHSRDQLSVRVTYRCSSSARAARRYLHRLVLFGCSLSVKERA